MSLSIPDFVNISDSVLCQNVQNESVLLNMDTQQYFGLNPVASEMWNRLVELHDVKTVEASLCRDFEADSEVLRTDLHRLISDLVGAGMLIAKSSAT